MLNFYDFYTSICKNNTFFSLILLKLILKIHFLLTKNKKDAIILYVKVSSIIVIGGWLDVGISRL